MSAIVRPRPQSRAARIASDAAAISTDPDEHEISWCVPQLPTVVPLDAGKCVGLMPATHQPRSPGSIDDTRPIPRPMEPGDSGRRPLLLHSTRPAIERCGTAWLNANGEARTGREWATLFGNASLRPDQVVPFSSVTEDSRRACAIARVRITTRRRAPGNASGFDTQDRERPDPVRDFDAAISIAMPTTIWPRGILVRSRRLELPRVAPQRPQRCASTNSATTARGRSRNEPARGV